MFYCPVYLVKYENGRHALFVESFGAGRGALKRLRTDDNGDMYISTKTEPKPSRDPACDSLIQLGSVNIMKLDRMDDVLHSIPRPKWGDYDGEHDKARVVREWWARAVRELEYQRIVKDRDTYPSGPSSQQSSSHRRSPPPPSNSSRWRWSRPYQRWYYTNRYGEVMWES